MNVGAKESVPYFDGYTRKAGEELHESCLFCSFEGHFKRLFAADFELLR